jgi:hypothetical protein
MSWGGKQQRYCPNCGKLLYDVGMSMDHVKSMMCGNECRDAWEIKYANMILGNNAPEPWQLLHKHMGCTHPPGCVRCNWCGFIERRKSENPV